MSFFIMKDEDLTWLILLGLDFIAKGHIHQDWAPNVNLVYSDTRSQEVEISKGIHYHLPYSYSAMYYLL